MCLAQGPQRSDAGEARTCGLSVSSQALYHWATALPAPDWVCWCVTVNKTFQDKTWERRRSLIFIESDQAPHDPNWLMPTENSGPDIRSANRMPERNSCHARNGFTRTTSESGNPGSTNHSLNNEQKWSCHAWSTKTFMMYKLKQNWRWSAS